MQYYIITLNGIQYTVESDIPLTQEQANYYALNAVNNTTNNTINKMSPATCIDVYQNSTHTITINVDSINTGKPPYTYTLLLDGISKASSSLIPNTTWSTPVTFSESIGSHTLTGQVVDSCGTPQTATDQCTSFNIISPLPTTGSIACTSSPSGTSVLLDGVDTTFATPVTLIGISQGSHTITFRQSGYQDCNVPVTVVAGSTTNASCTLSPIITTGNISCTSTPSGSQIWLDGSNTDQITPYTLTNISAASHTVTFKLAGYIDCSQTVIVTTGSTTNASCTLTSACQPIACNFSIS